MTASSTRPPRTGGSWPASSASTASPARVTTRTSDGGRARTTTITATPRSPNPNLAELATAPYYAVPVHPGDLGTKGGLLTDADARVLRADGSPIAGLYAAGNVAAAVMGETYPGPGATIGPAMAFGWIAVEHLAASGPTA
ncbi:FAD-binding protein [Streptomyces sp. NPDC057748]|uniref:FAD-binding protein n=1 Tax=unclassified Streptomyces TaxID=2593676 RepID=UPI0036C713CA